LRADASLQAVWPQHTIHIFEMAFTQHSILYLHGFLSSPQSVKARLLGDYLAAQQTPLHYAVPALPEEPGRALAAASAALAVERDAGRAVGLVGSSMGGFYATVLAQRHGLRAVLVNPSVLPHRYLHRYLGEMVNPYSGRRFTLDQRHVAELEAMAPGGIDHPDRLWLLAQSGDEVLDYRDAVNFYAGCRQTVEAGGDHMFQGFDRYLPDIIKFLQCAPE
jgi:uncharacterized protein